MNIEKKPTSAAPIVVFQVFLALLAVVGIRLAGIPVSLGDPPVGLYALAGLVLGAISYGVALLVFRRLHARSAAVRDLAARLRHGFAHFSLPTIVLIAACAGICEELFFRALVQNWLALHLPIGGSVLLAAILFAAAHGMSIAYFVIALLLGLLIGAAYALTDSLMLVIAWHFMYDLISLFVIIRHPQLLGITATAARSEPANEQSG